MHMKKLSPDNLRSARAAYGAVAQRAQRVGALLQELSTKALWFDWEQVVDILVKDALSWKPSGSTTYPEMRRNLLGQGLLLTVGKVETIDERTTLRITPFAKNGLTHYATELGLETLASLATLNFRSCLENVAISIGAVDPMLSSWKTGLLVGALDHQTLQLVNALRELELATVRVREVRAHSINGELLVVQEDSGIDLLLDALLTATTLGLAPAPCLEYGAPARSNALTALPIGFLEALASTT